MEATADELAKSPLRMAVVGTGIFGQHHAAAFSSLDTTTLVAVCDLDGDRADETAALYGAVATYTDFERLLARDDLDGISIATPDHTHTPLVEAAVDAGLHGLCEKPLALTAGEAAEVAARAEGAGVVLGVDFHNRVNPAFAAARDAIESGQLGRVRHGYLRLSNTTFVPLEMLPWSARTSALWFLGSHGIDILRFLLDDDVAAVYAVKRDGFLASHGVETDDFHLAILEWRDGTVVTIEHSWILPTGQPSVFDFKVELVGESGALYVDTSHSGILEIHDSAGLAYPDVLGLQPSGPGRVGGFMREAIARFVDAVRGDGPPLATAADGVRVAEVLEAIEESADSGRRVEV